MGTSHDRRGRRTRVLRHREVVDDETLHPGALVWLGEPSLCADELARFTSSGRARRRRPSAATA